MDSDLIDLHAWHVLAYAGDRLVGCVRIYPLAEGGAPPCLTETLLGEEQFSDMLRRLGKKRDSAIEIGRWVVDPALRTQGSLAPGIGAQLAAGAGALAFALVNRSEDVNGVAIFSAGSRDKQYMMLSRLGLRPVSGIEPVVSAEYDDVIRVMYCTNTEELQSRFRRMLYAMAETMGLDQMLSTSALHSG
jgi:N-acyl-L-homoserine lactone synthetase